MGYYQLVKKVGNKELISMDSFLSGERSSIAFLDIHAGCCSGVC